MASGTFRTPTNTRAGSGYSRYIYVNWSSTNDVNNNQSIISWHAYGGSNDSSTTHYVVSGPITVTINGTTVLNISNRIQLKKDMSLGSGSITVSHDSDGSKTVNVGISAAIYDSSINNTYSGTITMTPNPVYSLNISANEGSHITVERTLCTGHGSTGILTSGANKLCAGDLLKISFASDSNYAIDTHTVNGNTFTSDNTYTVSGNVDVVSTARALASQVGATDANVGSTSTITITKYNSTHCHSLRYSFNGLSGYITNTGGTSPSEVKYTETSIPFSVPGSFYNVMANTQSGICTITCTTYESLSSSTVVGTPSTCTITVSVSSGDSVPIVTGTVVDANSTTTTLTGNNNTLIRYKSTAVCTITATPRNSATIAAKYINNNTLSGNTYTYPEVSTTNFVFKALDSRGYTGTATVTPTMIPYIPLTCNPTLARLAPTENTITLSLNGNYFRGSFGAYDNTLTIQYRYRTTNGSWENEGAWNTISSGITYNTSSYQTPSPITLTESFDYSLSYVFQIRVRDGAAGVILSDLIQTVSIQKGLPIFDWGDDDFNINGTLKIFGQPVDLSGRVIKYVTQTVTTPYGNFLGDISENGTIGNEDISSLAGYVAGTSTPSTSAKRAAADIDGDGQITQADLEILNWFVVSGIDRTRYALARYDITYTDGTTGKAYGGVLKTIASSSGSGTSGEDGGWYTPSVDANGNLSWTPSKSGMPSVSSSNIKGPQGNPGTNGTNGADGNKWYFGLNIHGTDTTGTIFAGSGIAYANVNDGYIHTSTFNMYRCTVGGNSQTAQWVYIGTLGGNSTPASSIGNNIFYGSCSGTAAAKTVTCDSSFALEQGVVINVLFINSQSYDTSASGADPITLNVNNSGVKNAVGFGATTIPLNAWRSFEIVSFVYTGSVWEMIRGGTATTTYYGSTKLSNAVNSTSETEAATSSAVKAAYDLAAAKPSTSDVNTLIQNYISGLDARGVSY